MSEKQKVMIVNIKESKWNDKTYYTGVTSMGVEYSTTDPQIKQFVGVEHEYDVNSKPDKNGNMRHYINFPGQGGGFKGSGKGGGYGPDPEITAKNNIVMQLTEIVKLSSVNGNPHFSDPQNAVEFVKKNIKSLWEAYEYKGRQETPKNSLSDTPTGVPSVENLTTLMAEMGKFTSKAPFADYWNTHQKDIKALKPEELQALFAFKAHKFAEIECQVPEELDAQDIPF